MKVAARYLKALEKNIMERYEEERLRIFNEQLKTSYIDKLRLSKVNNFRSKYKRAYNTRVDERSVEATD